MTNTCGICKRTLSVADDPYSEDCGGDCLMCMAECDDPDCIAAVLKVPENTGSASDQRRRKAVAKTFSDKD